MLYSNRLLEKKIVRRLFAKRKYSKTAKAESCSITIGERSVVFLQPTLLHGELHQGSQKRLRAKCEISIISTPIRAFELAYNKQHQCNNQRYEYNGIPDSNTGCKSTGLYIDGMGLTAIGSICGQWSNISSNNQRWVLEAYGGNFRIRNVATGLYLDGDGNTANGSDLKMWSDASSTNLQWQFVNP